MKSLDRRTGALPGGNHEKASIGLAPATTATEGVRSYDTLATLCISFWIFRLSAGGRHNARFF